MRPILKHCENAGGNGPGGPLSRLVLKTLLAVLLLFVAFKGAGAADGIIRALIPAGESAPRGWKVKEWKGKADISVVKTQFGNAVHLKSANTSSAIYREMAFDIKEFPYINWRWKVTKIPKGADVRKRSADDQAAQVYVVFPRWPESVHSTKSKNTKYVVMRSGPAELGEWFQEKRNVYEDYKTLFKEEPPKAGSVSIMIDSDDTDSAAESFIGDIY